MANSIIDAIQKAELQAQSSIDNAIQQKADMIRTAKGELASTSHQLIKDAQAAANLELEQMYASLDPHKATIMEEIISYIRNF